MDVADRALARELLAMEAEDLRVRDELAADGSLFDGYHPLMRAVHERNADRLAAILAEHGWPTPERVGADASSAAWLVVQHAISRPGLMRAALALLGRPEMAGAVLPAQLAMLEDRICVFEGREQIYGTQFDWNDAGEMAPLPVADPQGVDARRASVGLEPLANAAARHRAAGNPPADFAARKAEAEAFARAVGWR